jgi:hypothetical protein
VTTTPVRQPTIFLEKYSTEPIFVSFGRLIASDEDHVFGRVDIILG